MSKRLFDIVIGNPPYQASVPSESDNKTYAAPVYNEFMDAANTVADKVELIHPARFLFDAGSTPKAWNRKMLQDPHFKVLHYEEDATKVFSNTEIKGGVAITYHDDEQDYGAIEVFTKYPSLNDILKKVHHSANFRSMSCMVITRTAMRLTDEMHKEHPEVMEQLSKGHPYDMSTNIFDRAPQLFYDVKPQDGQKYIQIFGREKNSRIRKYILAKYANEPENLYKYKVHLPSANGNGVFGEVLTQPVLNGPGIGATETFISVGICDTKDEAEAVLQYIKSKFLRAMLGVLKITQHLTPSVWKYVPLQDFTASSDIDWTKSVHEIDLQLYRKYGLSKEEIDFIETNVKEMV